MGALYRTTYPRMVSVVRRYVSDDEMVRDIVHDGFIIVLTSLDRLKDPDKLEPWMGGVMKRLALKSEAVARKHSFVSLNATEDFDREDQAPEDDEIGWDELSQMIDRLPEGYRKVFRLSVLDGLSHKEIGDMLAIGAHSSSSQLSRAKALLRKMVSDYRMNLLLVGLALVSAGLWYALRHPDPIELPSDNTVGNEEGTFISRKSDTNNVPEESSPSGGNSAISVSRNDGVASNDKDNATAIASEDTVRSESHRHDADSREGTESKDPREEDQRLHLYDRDNDTRNDHVAATLPLMQKGNDKWSVSLAYEGVAGKRNGDGLSYLLGDPMSNVPAVEVKESVHHDIPIVIGLSFRYEFNPRWSIESGLRFSYLSSDSVADCTEWHRMVRMRTSCIGVPLKVSYTFLRSHGLSLYGSAGFGLDIALRNRKSVTVTYPVSGLSESWLETPGRRIQWSGDLGIGIQYEFLPHMSIFAEPSVRYYFPGGFSNGMIWTDPRLRFTVPVGIRLSW